MDAYAKTGVYPMYDQWNIPFDRIDFFDPVSRQVNDFWNSLDDADNGACWRSA
jgi:hypothetical protein